MPRRSPSSMRRVHPALALLPLLALAHAGEPATPKLVDATTIWSHHITLRPADVLNPKTGKPVETGQFSDSNLVALGGYNWQRPSPIYPRTPLPAEGWTAAEFDDGAWRRSRGPFFAGIGPGRGPGSNEPLQVAHIALRARFVVADPAQVGALTMRYRGGAAVWVNGTEVARGNLPAGAITAETMAEAYGEGQERVRRLERIAIPAKLLRRGVNVLAVGLHRAQLVTAMELNGWTSWNTCGFDAIELTGAGGAPPPGIEIWNANALQEIGSPHPFYNQVQPLPMVDRGDPGRPLKPMALIAPRNGSASAQVVVSGPSALSGLSARLDGMKGAAGALPPTAIRVLFAAPGTMALDRRQPYLDFLSATPPTGQKIVSVWVVVDVPADAAPGEYAGKLSVGAGGSPVTVPVTLTVSPWALPARNDYTAHLGVMQSPETLAWHYEAPIWSDRHFALIEKTFQRFREMGNHSLMVMAIRESNLGATETMVRWVKRGDRYEPDFAVVDRYLELWKRTVGTPKVVMLYLFDVNSYPESALAKDFRGPEEVERVTVSLLDPATGRTTPMDAPLYGKPGSEEFWKPLIDGMRERVAKLGWKPGSLMLGLCSDAGPTKKDIAFFSKIAPDLR